MEALVEELARSVVTGIQAIAVVVIAIGVIEVLVALGCAVWRRSANPREERAIWLNLARWLVAGLTLQLAADIVQTTVAPTWDEIGRTAAIAATRTFLSHFLDRDIDAIRERQARSARRASGAEPS